MKDVSFEKHLRAIAKIRRRAEKRKRKEHKKMWNALARSYKKILRENRRKERKDKDMENNNENVKFGFVTITNDRFAEFVRCEERLEALFNALYSFAKHDKYGNGNSMHFDDDALNAILCSLDYQRYFAVANAARERYEKEKNGGDAE